MKDLDSAKLLLLKRVNRLQHQVLDLNPNIVSQRDIKNLRVTAEKLNTTLDELILCLEQILNGEMKWQNHIHKQSTEQKKTSQGD